MTASKLDLRNEYHALSGYFADNRWGLERLVNEVTALRDKREKAAALRAVEEAKRAAEKSEREKRIAERGSLEEFMSRKDMEESERKLSWLLRRAKNDIEREKTRLTDFAKSMSENPVYALSWSKDVFAASAKGAVARELIKAFAVGATFEEWKEEARRNALRLARNPAMSTSPTSNLMDAYLGAAWAEAADESNF
jgi:hypothetical protein